ncbi:MAG: aminotransferase class I/II-fold pyridoxal phosphate-dependent enzyme [Anaerolineae bacterium]|nr:aminotransferase class I/II-fold pyridoxal phosphate-dependent enzyme [Anaerolineae bacterium]MDW8298385.1 aminotransferase class I/II-fold pyridoxal phosphate-dependent enzyme [Anaerolineae bacterium]
MPKDLFDKVRSYTIAKEAMSRGIYPYFQPLQNSEGVTATFEGHEVIMLGSNNYLGLTTHPRVRQAAMDAIAKYGTSCTGSRFLNGTLELHHELERRLARFMGTEAALTFTTGYQVNVGTISALVGRGDYVIIDKDDHASIVDGCLMSFGEMKRFSHNDVDSLEKVLSRLPEDAGKLVVVDGVYSMGGDIAPLPEIVAICKKYGARIMVDDAHGIGVTGPMGRGTAAHFGLMDQVDLVMGTFSKSFASVGGFIAGNADVIHYVQHHARSLIFSASLPPANAATVLACLDIIEENPQIVDRLWENANYMRARLTEMGFDTGQSNTPIIPIIIRDDLRTVLAWRALVDGGVYTNPVLPPGVPANMSLLRTSYTATHTRAHLDRALEVFADVADRLDLIKASRAAVQVPNGSAS